MPFPSNIDLSTLNGNTGFRLDGPAADYWSGQSVASAGDVNGDGFDDLIVGAPHPNGTNTGASFVVFGKASGFAAAIDLSSLDGANGFKLSGEAAIDWSGWSVASAGDVNADGFADLIVGSPAADPNGSSSGAAYVIFGKASAFAANLDLSTLDGSNGFKMSGEEAGDRLGMSVASAGDVNGDGFADMIIGSQGADPTGDGSYLGAAYVVFGKATGFSADLDLTSLDGINGFRLVGAQADGVGGSPVASAGDVNGDGFDDLIVSTSIAFDPTGMSGGAYAATTYVVFGKQTGFAADFDLADLDGNNGFQYVAWAGNVSVSSAGDVNGDGFGDLIIGSYVGYYDGQYSGGSAVVFGTASGFAVDGPGSLDGSNGFMVFGAPGDGAGASVSSAGDVNGDGFDDLIVGAIWADPHGTYSGAAYVVFGKASGFAATLDLSTLNGVNGFKLSGVAPYDQVGLSVSAAGDVNGDGFADLIMGSRAADPHGSASGSSYVVFGGAFGATVTTNGTAAAEMLIGGTGNDTLSGGGGQDVFHGGAGNDRLTIKDTTFRLADGGNGTDTLAIAAAGLSLDLTEQSVAVRLQGIEHIDLTGNGANSVKVNQLAILGGIGTVSGGGHILTVEGNAGDTVSFSDGLWTKVGSFTNVDGTFNQYVLGDAIINIEQGVKTMPASSIELSSFDGLSGFVLNGIGGGDRSGRSVASAGDINGDGFEDLLIGAPYSGPHGYGSGQTYVVFGKASGFTADFDLFTLDGTNGFQLSGVAAYDYSGRSVASAGDVNGDGFSDIIIGAWGADPHGAQSGSSYVVFGKASGFTSNFDLSTLDGSNGFRLDGVAADDSSGLSVASAGDVNGDGFDDIIIGAERADPFVPYSAGASYVVFGKASGFAASIDLSSLDGTNGFKVSGVSWQDFSGSSVSSAGDVNGDGFDDLIIGARNADPTGSATYVGASYVVFGKEDGFAADINLSTLDGSNGFRLIGEYDYSGSGASVASAGDVNGDGYDDIIIGAYRSDSNGLDSGASYVVFGKGTAFSADVDLGALNGSDGFRIDGVAEADYSGVSVASAGDINGDGYDDLIIGADRADPNGESSGVAYVVFGKATVFPAHLDLSSLDGTNGFKLNGEALGDHAGISVASAGDINGDGYDDLIIGADRADPNGVDTGSSYVMFGGAFGATVVTTGTSAAEMLIGGTGDDTLKGNGGHDVFHGGAGNDKITIGDLSFLLIDGGTGVDTLALGGTDLSFDPTIYPPHVRMEGIERIDLRNAGSNTLTLNRFVVLGGLGAVSGGTHVLTVQGTSADTVQFVEAGWQKTGSFVTGEGTFDRYVLGDAEVDIRRGVVVPGATIMGTSGNDIVNMSTTVPGQSFATNLNDLISGLGGNDTLSGLGGDDTLNGGGGDDILDGGAGDDTLNGDAGNDTATYALATAGVKVNLLIAGAQDTLGAGKDTLSSIRDLVGSDFGDTLTGDAGNNVLTGGGGDDVLEGGAGNDQLDGGAGTDTATYASASAGVKVSVAIAGLQGTLGAGSDTLTGIENLTGSAFADTLTGDGGVNVLNGGGGDDVLIGGAGADSLNGSTGSDTASYANAAAGVTASLTTPASNTGDAAGDTYVAIENLTGSQFGDVLTGNGAGNILNGGQGADQLDGRAGADRLSGGGGLDTLTGGLGTDTFAFEQSLVAGNVSTVTDFSHVDDTFALSLTYFSAAGVAGALDANAFFVGTAAHDADDRIIYNATLGKLLYDADGAGGAAAKTFATVGTGLPIDATDFVLI